MGSQRVRHNWSDLAYMHLFYDSVLCLPWTPLPSLPQPLIERWLLCWPQCLKRQLLPHHRFNVVLTRFTLWGKRDTASGEAGLTAVVTAFRGGGQAPRGRCNLSTKVYTAMSISDFSASQLRWLTPHFRAEEREAPRHRKQADSLNCHLAKSEFTAPETDPESWATEPGPAAS